MRSSGTLVNHTAACGTFATNGPSSPINVTGLTNGTSYTCKVRTTTTAGVSAWSASSNAVVPEVAEPPVTYFHNDISGSPMLATDGAGAVIWKENYRPYGERLNNQAGSSKNKLGFAGKQFDTALQVVAKSTSKTCHPLERGSIADHLHMQNSALGPVELTASAIKYEVN